MKSMELVYEILPSDSGKTVAEILASRLQLSRSLVTKLKQQSKIFINNKPIFTNYQVQVKEMLGVDVDLEEANPIIPENIPLEILYEDADFLVINKPAGMPVHPSHKHQSGTLANGVTYYWQQQSRATLFRPINRLDKNTSGIVLIGQNQYAHQSMDKSIREYKVKRVYTALVEGSIKDTQGTICYPIGRKAEGHIERVVITDQASKNSQKAITHFQVLKRSTTHTLVQLELETGRTHQIRVHMSFIGHPLCGDTLYGGTMGLISRQALHARLMSFTHPRKGKKISFTASLPDDILDAIAQIPWEITLKERSNQ